MSVRKIRLELARNPDFPLGSNTRGYEFKAPLTEDGTLDQEAWPSVRADCTVRRFWEGEDDEGGRLVHRRNRWLFHYNGMDADEDEPIFRFDRHRFVEGEYVSIIEHNGEQRTFRIARVG